MKNKQYFRYEHVFNRMNVRVLFVLFNISFFFVFPVHKLKIELPGSSSYQRVSNGFYSLIYFSNSIILVLADSFRASKKKCLAIFNLLWFTFLIPILL